MKAILSLFGRSPFGPIQAHMEKTRGCIERIQPLFGALWAGQGEDLKRISREIYDLESAADTIKNDLRNHLPKSVFLPIARGDLLEILDVQDSIADRCQDLGTILTLRKWALHQALKGPLDELLREATKVCTEAADIVDQLDELVETSFGGKEAAKVLGMIERLNADETIADSSGIACSKRLFELENELGPIDVVMWSRVFDLIGEMANTAERLGNRLRLLIAK